MPLMNREERRRYNKEYWVKNRHRLAENQNKYKQSRHKSYREFVYRYKMRPCMDCGVQYNPWVMHFDHRDPSIKNFTIGRFHNLSEKEILIEIEKCDVVCSNCHAERTHKQRVNNPSGRIKV